MEPKPLTEQLSQSGLPERAQLILALAPGCLFGFPPDNLDAIMERVDCVTCRRMMELSLQLMQELRALQARVDEVRRPVRERNARRQREYERQRRVLVFGRFARPNPQEPEPHYERTAWYVEAKARIDGKFAALALLEKQDVPHWGDEHRRVESQKVLAQFVVKDRSWAL
ncbi:hypothetical protein HYV74_02710 [Candidatus Uhrbacteria bacterium]|nr:hypothetical protein [Candidatus Uhrbacteria bacterium]